MKTIQLTQGKFAIVDDQDYKNLLFCSWSMSGNGDVQAWINGGMISLHRYLMGKKIGFEIDHVNGNKLDNRRKNLRFCSRHQNSANKNKYSTNTTGFKGVTWEKQINKFAARITFKYKNITLGRFNTAIEVARAYNKAAVKYFGEFARLNEISND